MALPKLKAPHISKRVVLISAGLLVVLSLFSLGAVYQVKQERHDKAIAAQEATKKAEAERAYKVRIASLEQQVATLQGDKQAACLNYKQLTTARATRSLVVTPLAVHCE